MREAQRERKVHWGDLALLCLLFFHAMPASTSHILLLALSQPGITPHHNISQPIPCSGFESKIMCPSNMMFVRTNQKNSSKRVPMNKSKPWINVATPLPMRQQFFMHPLPPWTCIRFPLHAFPSFSSHPCMSHLVVHSAFSITQGGAHLTSCISTLRGLVCRANPCPRSSYSSHT